MYKNIILALLIGCSIIYSETSLMAAGSKEKAAKSVKKTSAKIKKSPFEDKEIPEGFYLNQWKKFKEGNEEEKEDALNSLRGVIAKDFNQYKAHYYLGIMYYELKEYSMALTYFKNAGPNYLDSADYYTRLGETLDKLGKNDEAVNAYNFALSVEPNDTIALARIGEEEFKKQNYDEAFKKVNAAYEADSKNIIALNTLGKIYLLRKESANAATMFEKALTIEPENTTFLINLSKAYENIGKHKEAADLLLKAQNIGKKTKDDFTLTGYSLAKNLMMAGKYSEAVSAYKKAIKTSTDKAEGYYGLGLAYEEQNKDKLALKAFIAAYEEDKKYSEKIKEYADKFASEGNYKQAESLFELLKKDSKYKTEVKQAIAELKEKKKNIKKENTNAEILPSNEYETENAYLTAFEQDKTNSEAAEWLMNYYNEHGYYEEALKWFKKYNKLHPTSDYNKKLIEQEYKKKIEQDNLRLYGKANSTKETSSPLSDDEIYNIAMGNENDRLRENAFKILITRKNYKEDSHVYDKMLNFYLERGNKKEALKCVSKMKSAGILSENEAKSKREQINNN